MDVPTLERAFGITDSQPMPLIELWDRKAMLQKRFTNGFGVSLTVKWLQTMESKLGPDPRRSLA